jgi:hypothetical protein
MNLVYLDIFYFEREIEINEIEYIFEDENGNIIEQE